jgi:hypothetical protein
MSTISVHHLHRIVTGFEQGTLPREEWTHEAHLLMALWYALHLPEAEVLPNIRTGIRSYNEAVGTANTTTSGYHETLTVFYTQAVKRFLKESGTTLLPEALATILLASEIADRAYPLRFYSKERLFSPEARAVWVEPEKEGES